MGCWEGSITPNHEVSWQAGFEQEGAFEVHQHSPSGLEVEAERDEMTLLKVTQGESGKVVTVNSQLRPKAKQGLRWHCLRRKPSGLSRHSPQAPLLAQSFSHTSCWASILSGAQARARLPSC